MTRNVEFFWDVLLAAKLKCEREEAEDDAGHEREDGVGRVGNIVDTETLADDNVGGVTHKEDHACSVGCCEFGDEPGDRIDVHDFGVIHQKHSARENDRVISEDHAEKGEHDVEIEVELPRVGATLIGDPESCGLEDSCDVERDGHVREGEE